MSNDKYIGIKVPAEKLAEIGKAAEKKGQTVAGYVRMLLYEKLESEKAE